MYVLIAYDVEARRTRLFHKLLSRYLMQEQNSVFSGDLSDALLRALDAELSDLIIEGDRVFQVLAENRHNVSMRILNKTGNGSMVKQAHDHHKSNAVVI